MKVLFAIRDDSDIVDSLVRKYNKDNDKKMLYKEAKNFTAITKEVQENNDYDRIVISDNFDEKVNNSSDKEAILLKKLKGLLSVAKRKNGKSIPVIFICKNNKTANSLMELKLNNLILKKDASKKIIYELINNPRNSSQAKEYYQSIVNNNTASDTSKKIEKKEKMSMEKKIEKKENKKVSENKPMDEKLKKCLKYLNREGMAEANYVSKFEAACEFFGKQEINDLISNLTPKTKKILANNSSKFNKYLPKEERTAVNKKKAEKTEPVEEKRGRGRPRKNPAGTVATVAAATATAGVIASEVKRGRGRPRKNPVETEIVEEVKNTEPVKKVTEKAKNKVKEVKKKAEPIKEKIEEVKIPKKEKKNEKEDWDLDEDEDINLVANNEDEFDFDFEDKNDDVKEVEAPNKEVSNDDTLDIDDFDFDEDENDNSSDDEFDFDDEEKSEDSSNDDFDFDDEDESNDTSDDDFDFDDEEESEDSSDDEFDFEDDEESEDSSDDDFDFEDDEESENSSDDEFDFEDEEESEDSSDDDFDLEDDEESENSSDDEFDFEDDEESENSSDDEFDFEDEEESEDSSDDDFDLEDDEESENSSDDEFDFEDDEELENSSDDEFTFDDEEESEDSSDDEFDFEDEEEQEDSSDDEFTFDDEEESEDSSDDDISFEDEEESEDDDIDIDEEDLEDLDDDEIDALIAEDEDDDEADLNLIDDDDDDDADNQDDIMNFDNEEDEDDDILGEKSDKNMSKGIENLDDDNFVNLDDDESGDDSDDEFVFDDEDDSDNDIMNFDDDNDSEDNSDDDIINLDDDSENDSDDDTISFDDDNSDEDSNADGDFIFDLDDEDDNSDDIKIDDAPISNASGAAFSGIANKNYNPNYDISKQLNEINNDETSTSEDINQNDKMVAVANMDMINIGDNQKVVAFVGAHNSGNSFIVNNLAQMLSEQGVKTAVVDLTKNKNSYYIYTENEENLRNIAYSSFEKLKSGIADGIKVNKCLTVYTALPNSDTDIEDKANSMTTLLNNYSLVLLDCDFDTGLEFFNIAQDIYFVQSFDILTIQALTSFIKKLKMNKVDYENKMKIVINKYVNLGTINERAIVAAMSVYNSPDTTYQLDLFDRNGVEYFLVPFEEKNYCKYLEEVVKCKLTIRGYTKSLLNSLSKLAKSVYPIGKKGKNK